MYRIIASIGIPNRLYHKIWLIMRLTTVVLIASLMQVSAIGFAQKISLFKTNATLKTVLKEIRTQSGYDFVATDDLFNISKPVNVNLKEVELKAALDEIFKNQALSYSINKKTITISEKESTFLERLADRWASIDVSGRVVDADGRGLPGASVSVKGKGGKAVSTGANGSFYLKGVEEDAVLVISFIGYVTKEVKAAKELGDVVLEVSLSKLDEVQVIAYGTTTQRLSTGNVTTIKADVIEKQPVNNPLLALQGRVPGLFIEQATGFAGTGVKVRIQGENSLNSGNDPFYVIDGVPFISQLLPGSLYGSIQGKSGSSGNYSNPLNFINPTDIESISILKDADATAIYGSRAANGAVLISTKKGKSGDMRVDLNLLSGWSKVPKRLDLMNGEQYLEMRREALINKGIPSPVPGPNGDNDLNGNWDMNRVTDWQKELIGKTGGYQDLNASVSGGNDRTTFLVGAGYHRETNVFPGNFSDKKASVHFNLNSSSKDQNFKIHFSGSYLNDNNQLPNVDLTYYAMTLIPYAPALLTPEGNVNWAPSSNGTSTFLRNPIGFIFDRYLDKSANLTSNGRLSYKLLPSLTIESSFGYTKLITENLIKKGLQSTNPENLPYTSRNSVFTNSKVESWLVEPQINYNTSINKGKLEVLVGATFSNSTSDQTGISAVGFSNDLVMDDILSAPTIRALSSINSLYKYNALFGRVNYNWLNKYLLNMSFRRDGSSRFGPANQFHNFGSVGAAWIFSEEKIFKDKMKWLSFGKLRSSFGTQGNDQISDYQFLSLYNPVPQAVPYQGIVTYQPNRLTNSNLQWEETKKIQFGLDLGFLSDRILFNTNYYRNRSSNQLSLYLLPAITGFENIVRNQNCTIQNSGWEFMISSRNLQLKNFSWSSSINLTIPKTILVAYPDLENSTEVNTAFVGESLRAVKVYHFLGVDPITGVYQFEGKDGSPTTSPMDPDDKTVIIDPLPKYYGGIQNTLMYKGLELDILFQFTKQVAINDIKFGGLYRTPGRYGFGQGNQPASVLDRWQKPGDHSSIQKFTTTSELNESWSNASLYSDAAWSDASFIRLKNVSLSWRLPEQFIKRIKVRNGNIFLQGQNLWTLTNYKGLDPETKSSTSLPILRVITMGLKVGI
ncbi:TonB-linked SusC/RagA family outer membrane protein [Pedobacter africanus]|uniref:TonB-linked SusC/RagA family outer membrane protein n=1 Tax=Pedobacter africanus TaxID=151894 RepID=A0ACC6L4N8_9SPHI|nr:SusC/RagA family TonB-linked outer membrane protein [Pedobacter africanus]MDR6786454.1 TonB-linked SusC/RagA family outer membrane protein [Pedobacter africanus]